MKLKFLPAALLTLAACAPAQAQQGGERMIEQLENADTNKDGAVSRIEFATYRSGQFAKLDRSKDGYITDGDIPGFIQNRLPPEMSLDSIKTNFDANKDGKVSQTEFVNGPTIAFDRVDANSDHVVTREELDAARAILASPR